MSNNVFDLMDEMTAQLRQREFKQRAHAMPDWEKQFLLGFLQYTEAHPEVLDALPPQSPDRVPPTPARASCDAPGARYRLIAVPGTELTDACRGCGGAHEIQACGAIHERLMR